MDSHVVSARRRGLTDTEIDAIGAPERWAEVFDGRSLTALRLAAAPGCAVAIACSAHVTALALFVLAVATDLADGRVARRYGETSALGGTFDHATDATFASLGLFAVALTGELPYVLSLFVVIAFVQYMLDSGAVRGEETAEDGSARLELALARASLERLRREEGLGRWLPDTPALGDEVATGADATPTRTGTSDV